MFMSSPEGGRNRQIEKIPPPPTPLDFLKWFRAKGSYMYSPANACLANLPIHGAMGPRGDILPPPPPPTNLVAYYRYLNKGLTKGP